MYNTIIANFIICTPFWSFKMKGKRVEGEMHMKASADLERSVEDDMEVEDPKGKSLAEFIDSDDGEDEDTQEHD